MAKIVVIIQSSYIPWKGYFDLLNSADEVILLDDVQYTRQDWRNRNVIKTPAGPRWLTIPVASHGSLRRNVDETRVTDPQWALSHWQRLRSSYRAAPYFDAYRPHLEELYTSTRESFLSAINRRFLDGICAMLGMSVRFSRSTDYERVPGRTERLISLCQQAGAGEYLSGPAARGYLEEGRFAAAGIALRYMDYAGYPEYRQLYPPFEHHVSVLDLILNEGPNAPRYMKTFGRAEPINPGRGADEHPSH